uniref:Uncharacterized protein n=1 Tax=Nelumbo nucifera TaxID=4432 RepID=A0A822XZB0_NELNU|nr:TPA_asm: hypothetical protein HUJ06_027176 [Nelumbo nucifera]DAD25710.1 TPA_asm: hypothetical protein HUJ06_027177 [Nelumbo nucifera]DAD26704.1 TPA_asm: hypothetical protein HUJ06_028172 [Nelumbo nucifera]
MDTPEITKLTVGCLKKSHNELEMPVKRYLQRNSLTWKRNADMRSQNLIKNQKGDQGGKQPKDI